MTAASQPRADFRLSLGSLDLGGASTGDTALPDITATVRPRLIALQLTEKRGGEADQLEITLDDTDGLLALPRKGQVIRLSLGWAAGAGVTVGLVDKGRYTVDEVEWSGAPDQVRITARSADLTADFRVRREEGHVGTTLGDIARKVAARNSYRLSIAPGLAAIAVPALAQHQQSDMALLRRLGRDHHAVATVKDRTLILSPIGRGATAGGRALPQLTLRRAGGSGYSYRELDRTQEAGVEARWHDPDTAERHTVTAGGSGGASGGGRRHRLKRIYHSQADAQAAADSANARAARAEYEFAMTLALGRPDISPEQGVTLAGFKPAIDARQWIVAEITHSLGRDGLGSQIRLENAG